MQANRKNTAYRVPDMEMERQDVERRKAKRIYVDLKMKIEKCVAPKRTCEMAKWADTVQLKNVSYLGAFFEYGGLEHLNVDDMIKIDLVILVPFGNIPAGEHIPLKGFAKVVRVQQERKKRLTGVGVQFLEPLSFHGVYGAF